MDELKITGEVEDIIYQNKDNGDTVFTLTTEDDEVSCVGTVPDIHSGETLEIRGNWTMHALYGRQVQVQYYEKAMPATAAGMEKYLSSGLIKGIGAKTAKRIVERFGEATFYVIEEKPDMLTEIKRKRSVSLWLKSHPPSCLQTLQIWSGIFIILRKWALTGSMWT